MAILTALRQLNGDYGSITAGEIFYVAEETAVELEAAGLVQRYRPPAPKAVKPPQNKMMPPPENK
jgi:hypothetical protein